MGGIKWHKRYDEHNFSPITGIQPRDAGLLHAYFLERRIQNVYLPEMRCIYEICISVWRWILGLQNMRLYANNYI